MLKKIIHKLFIGFGMGSSILTILLIFTQLAGFESFFQLITSDFTRQALCCILAAITFNVLSIIYNVESLHMGLKILFHMGLGLIIYFPIAFYANWIPTTYGIGILIITITFILIGSFIIWLGYYLYYRHQAQQINNKIKSSHK